jgi:hypothetical protein
MILEGDILDIDGQILMAHPPEIHSDCAFSKWFTSILEAGKGAKLDFKYPDTVEPCLTFLSDLGKVEIPVFLNADIVHGPNCCDPHHRGEEFVRLCRQYFPQATLSLGFCVGEAKDNLISHSESMMREMLHTASRWEGHVTICLCSTYLQASYALIQQHLFETDYTFTLWNYEPVVPQLGEWIKGHFPPERTFYDFKDSQGRPVRI